MGVGEGGWKKIVPLHLREEKASVELVIEEAEGSRSMQEASGFSVCMYGILFLFYVLLHISRAFIFWPPRHLQDDRFHFVPSSLCVCYFFCNALVWHIFISCLFLSLNLLTRPYY